MQLDHILVMHDVVALDVGAIVHLAAPNPSVLKVLSKILVDKLGYLKQRAATTDRERAIVVRLFLIGLSKLKNKQNKQPIALYY